MAHQHWKIEKDDAGITWLCLDKADASANVLSSAVLTELSEVLEPIRENLPEGLVIWSGKDRSFIMGADIKEFDSIKTPERAYELVRLTQQLFAAIEDLGCPTVAAINGVCLGGGLELAMACDYRVVFAGDKKVLGLPEVKLGLHPGFGGTVRAIRICGVRAGMQLMLTGNSISAGKAKSIGLVDKITSADNWRQDAAEMIARAPPRKRAPFVDRP